MSKLQINGYSNLVKDPTSGGVVNSDPHAYAEYKNKRSILLNSINEKKAMENKLIVMESDINKLKVDIRDIKDMLNNIISKLT